MKRRQCVVILVCWKLETLFFPLRSNTGINMTSPYTSRKWLLPCVFSCIVYFSTQDSSPPQSAFCWHQTHTGQMVTSDEYLENSSPVFSIFWRVHPKRAYCPTAQWFPLFCHSTEPGQCFLERKSEKSYQSREAKKIVV